LAAEAIKKYPTMDINSTSLEKAMQNCLCIKVNEIGFGYL